MMRMRLTPYQSILYMHIGLRRVRPPVWFQQRAEAGTQPDAPSRGAQAHRRHPRRRPRRLRPQGVLRRHHHARHPGRRRRVRGSLLRGASRPPRRAIAGVQRPGLHAAGPRLRRAHAARRVQEPEPGHGGPRGALRGAHRGSWPLLLLHQPPPAQRRRRHHGPGVPPDARGQVRQGRQRGAGAGRAHPQRLRQQVLLRPHRQAGALQVGPGPHQRPDHQTRRHALRAQPGRLLRPVRQVHGQDEPDGRAHGQRRRGPPQLRSAQRRPRRLSRPARDRRRRRGARGRRVIRILFYNKWVASASCE
uniref:Uncharacterized protein n=1 Tax=Zea mays TaxID=4577 RepID=C4IZM0_MAIZE|nr:unknown [Zea mays]